jgi:hypothetical protein
MLTTKVVSPTRRYVAVCYKGNFDGHYFRTFTLPLTVDEVPAHAKNLMSCQTHLIVNNSEYASWYFLNVLNFSACIDGCFSFEDFQNVKDEEQVRKDLEIALKSV